MTSEQKKIKATLIERGNGFASVGDYVYRMETDTVYRVVALGVIHTGARGVGSCMEVQVVNTGMCAAHLTEQEYEDITCTVIL